MPPGLDRKQALFLDGIRHAAELAELAYARLVATLTDVALSGREGGTQTGTFTEPFLDAWAVVDSVDRLRGLLHLMPGLNWMPRPDGQPGFRENTQSIRDLRNVSDHLAERIDQVVAVKGTALGRLSWATVLPGDPVRILSCAIIPGTFATGNTSLVNPAGKAFTNQTDHITLAAGEHSASLSSTMREVARVVEGLEDGMNKWLRESGLEGKQAGADLLVVAVMQMTD